MRIALDTNVLVYAEGVNGEHRSAIARRVLKECAEEDVIVPVQALAELFTFPTRKARWSVATSRAAVLEWYDAYACAETSSSVLLDAMELSAAHGFALWDAIMLAASAQAGCRLFLSQPVRAGVVMCFSTITGPMHV